MNRRTFVQTSSLIASGAAIGMGRQTSAAIHSNSVNRVLDSEEYTDNRIESVKPSSPFIATTKSEAQSWQTQMRGKLEGLLIDRFPNRCPLSPEIKEKKEFSTYTRELLYFQSRENLTVKAYFIVPKNFKKPGPCMICLPGHGRGVDDIVGINEDGSMRTSYGGYQNDFALQCVEHGFAALAVEQFGFGARRDERARSQGAGSSSCDPSSGIALMLGETMVGWRVWDLMRSVDYLQTRNEIDDDRIGAMGISGGGTTTFWGACMDTRIKAAFVSGYYCTFDRCIMAVPHCIDNYIPGILKVADMPEFSGLIAPRPFFIESGTEDSIFMIDGVKKAVSRAKDIYSVFSAKDRVGSEHFEAGHSFYGKKGFEFLKKWL